MADENLGRRPARFATDEAMARLDKVEMNHLAGFLPELYGTVGGG